MDFKKFDKVKPGYEDKADLSGLEKEDLVVLIKIMAPYYRLNRRVEMFFAAIFTAFAVPFAFLIIPNLWGLALAPAMALLMMTTIKETVIWLRDRKEQKPPLPPSTSA